MTLNQTFSHVLRQRALAHPHRDAVRDGELVVTYKQLDRASDALARRIAAAGAKPGDRVILMADNSAIHLAAAVAVWRTGAVLTTLYASSGPSEIAYALSHSEAVVAVVDARANDLVRSVPEAPPTVTISNDDFAATDVPVTWERWDSPEADPSDLALICYTSGSTAAPKAVMHSHTGLLAAAEAYAEVWHLGPEDRTVVCLPMAWAFGLVTTSMATLTAAGQIIVLQRTKPDLIIEALNRFGGTFLAGVTTMFVKLTERLEEIGNVDMPGLRLCISGGEPRNENVFARWTQATGCPVHDVYAASECFPAVTYDPYVDPIPVQGSSGKVASGASMRVVDENGRDVAPGTVGQALWKGPALFLGYWKDPEQTAKALTPDGWYRTGDLVKVNESGYVFVEGRLSDIIIRGGSNVSPSEVEAVLASHPSVRSAAVVGLPDELYGELVAAALILREGHTLDPEGLRTHCTAHLAGYKVPGLFVALDALPINSRTGKVDRRQLKQDLQKKGVPA
ncbi:class I adenylate-forming enzyme family protein [Arthrobacter sp. M4]|uniref:class I adenylate-forming enzyme family protein n=1 Tax=Arthrobacter sp. M4 TaxID=218160 RepID=UPI001CDCE1E2|nr:class I adenylate-forming enzyme family protein [Arthrobacter sp. M4]MCA4134823.1 acyl--CoA ligase [Arthrobacter sp. M4]